MHAESIDLHAAPGLGRPLVLSGLSPQLILLVGPNGSGKSTLGRLLRWSLWAQDVDPGVQATIRWRIEGKDVPSSSMLFAGQVRWIDGAPSVPTEAAGAWSMNVRALLSDCDGDIARVIQTALSGGFDLPAARRPVEGSGRAPSKQLRDLAAASEALREALDGAVSLARDAAELDALQADVDEAAAAHQETVLAGAALALAGARQDQREAEQALGRLPPGLDRLRPGLDQEIEAARTELAASVVERTALEAQEKDLEATIAAEAFPGAEPTAPEIAAWRARARELQHTEREVRARKATLRGAETRRDEARGAILREPGHALGPDAIDALEAALTAHRHAKAERVAAKRLLEDLPDAPPAEDPEAHRDVARTLRRWLHAPPAPSEPEPPPTFGAWLRRPLALALLLGLLPSLVAVVAWVLRQGSLSALPAGAIGLLLGLMASAIVVLVGQGVCRAREAARESPPDERALIAASWPVDAASAPTEWTLEAVQRCLDRAQATEDEARAAARRADQLRSARRRLGSAEARERDAQAALQATSSRWDLTPGLSDLALAAQARRIEAFAAARDAVEQVQAEWGDLRGQAMAQRAELQRWLEGIFPAFPVPDGAEAVAAVDRVADQLTRLREAEKDLARTREALGREGKQEGRLRAKGAALWAAAGLSPDADEELQVRLAALDAWSEGRTARSLADATIAQLETQLASRPDLLLLGASEAESLIAQQQGLADTHQARQARLSSLEREIEEASSGRTIQTRAATLDLARAALAEQRDRDAQKAVGRALLRWVDGAVSRCHTPPVLERARRRFLQFTEGRYRLEVSGAAFEAVDTEAQRRLSLDELSDGTRIQLLLATRLAFLEETEGEGPTLPLFLDEVLSTTDSSRFEQVGRCLLQLVQEGRQVIYATAVQAEVALWEQLCASMGRPRPALFDLDTLDEGSPWPVELPIAAPVRRLAPPSQGIDAEEFARRLGLSLPSSRDSFGAWPLVLLLHDDLPAAAACWSEGIERVGPLRARHRDGLPLPLGEGQLAQLEARIDLLQAVIELRRVGRGEIVPWVAVEASGAVTPTRRADLIACLEEQGGEAEAFVAAVRRIPRMSSKKADQLQEHLRAEGLLPDRPPLELDALAEQALRRVKGHVEAGALEAGGLRPFVAWVDAVLRRAEGAPAS